MWPSPCTKQKGVGTGLHRRVDVALHEPEVLQSRSDGARGQEMELAVGVRRGCGRDRGLVRSQHDLVRITLLL